MEDRLNAIENAILELADAMRAICEKMAAMDEEVDKLAKGKIYDRLEGVESEINSMVGGFNGLLSKRRGDRYKSMIGANEALMGYAPKYKKVFQRDITEDLLNEIMKYMEQDGASEEQLPAIFDSVLSDLRARFEEEQAEGEGVGHEAMESPEMEKAEHEAPAGTAIEVEIEKKPIDPDEALKNMARRFKGARVG